MSFLERVKLFEMVISKKLAEKGRKYTHQAAADFLGVTRGKYAAWVKSGQWPVGDDLQMLIRDHGFSPAWLLMGEGEPLAGGVPQKDQSQSQEQLLAAEKKILELREEVANLKLAKARQIEEVAELKVQLADQQHKIILAVGNAAKHLALDEQQRRALQAAVFDYEAWQTEPDTRPGKAGYNKSTALHEHS